MFEGWLIKVGDTIFPMKYIQANTYKARPDQRLDQGSESDMTGELHRNVLEHTRTKIEFESMPLNNTDLREIRAILDGEWISELERRVDLTYYNSETDSYKSGECYMPDAEYTIKTVNVDTNTIEYNPVRYAFIEY